MKKHYLMPVFLFILIYEHWNHIIRLDIMHREMIHAALVMLGITLNFTAIAVNGWKMPIYWPASDEKPDKPIDENTRLKFLCDWIPLSPWFYGSIGDCLSFAAIAFNIARHVTTSYF